MVSNIRIRYHCWKGEQTLFLQRFPLVQPPTELVRIPQKSLHDVAPPSVNLLDIVPLLGTEVHNLSWFESAVVEQVGQALFAFIGKHRLENLPKLAHFQR